MIRKTTFAGFAIAAGLVLALGVWEPSLPTAANASEGEFAVAQTMRAATPTAVRGSRATLRTQDGTPYQVVVTPRGGQMHVQINLPRGASNITYGLDVSEKCSVEVTCPNGATVGCSLPGPGECIDGGTSATCIKHLDNGGTDVSGGAC